MTGNVEPVNVQVLQTSEQTKINNIVLLSIIYFFETSGWMGVSFKSQRYDSQHHQYHSVEELYK